MNGLIEKYRVLVNDEMENKSRIINESLFQKFKEVNNIIDNA